MEPKYVSTVEELHRGEYEVEGDVLVMDILDTSGMYQFPAMRELAIKHSQAVILVYAIDDRSSWDNVKVLYEEASLHFNLDDK